MYDCDQEELMVCQGGLLQEIQATCKELAKARYRMQELEKRIRMLRTCQYVVMVARQDVERREKFQKGELSWVSTQKNNGA